MIRIVTGWSNQGGSTTAHINLCNLFNENGIDCKLYGEHDWHLGKCRSGRVSELKVLNEGDVLISHYCALSRPPEAGKHIYSMHEKELSPLNALNLAQYDCIHFVNEQQKDWHLAGLGCETVDCVVIPNVYDGLKMNQKSPASNGVAGVIGSIDENKNTHISIEKALKENYRKVILFGEIAGFDYFKSKVQPLLGEDVILAGYQDDKQQMYDMVEAVFLSSSSECAPLVKGECKLTGTLFVGNENTRGDADPVSREDILAMWKRCLEL